MVSPAGDQSRRMGTSTRFDQTEAGLIALALRPDRSAARDLIRESGAADRRWDVSAGMVRARVGARYRAGRASLDQWRAGSARCEAVRIRVWCGGPRGVFGG